MEGYLSTEKENKVKKTFSIDPKIYRKFAEKCGRVNYSRQVEDLMKAWVEGDREVNPNFLPELAKVSSVEFLTELEAIAKGWLKDRRKSKRGGHPKSERQGNA